MSTETTTTEKKEVNFACSCTFPVRLSISKKTTYLDCGRIVTPEFLAGNCPACAKKAQIKEAQALLEKNTKEALAAVGLQKKITLKNMLLEKKLFSPGQATLGIVFRPGYCQGIGRYTKTVSILPDLEKILKQHGFLYVVGNDALRGGGSGQYVVITGKK